MAKHDSDIKEGKKEDKPKDVKKPSEEQKKEFNIRQPRESDKLKSSGEHQS